MAICFLILVIRLVPDSSFIKDTVSGPVLFHMPDPLKSLAKTRSGQQKPGSEIVLFQNPDLTQNTKIEQKYQDPDPTKYTEPDPETLSRRTWIPRFGRWK